MIGKTTVPALKTLDLQGPTVGKAHDTTCSRMKMAIGCQEDTGEWRGPEGWDRTHSSNATSWQKLVDLAKRTNCRKAHAETAAITIWRVKVTMNQSTFI